MLPRKTFVGFHNRERQPGTRALSTGPPRHHREAEAVSASESQQHAGLSKSSRPVRHVPHAAGVIDFSIVSPQDHPGCQPLARSST